jgi:hypothetical protein
MPPSSLIDDKEDLKWHPLSLKFELMKRVIVVVEDGTIGVRFHPSLKRNPLRFLKVTLKVSS